ncbi:MAG: GNAT family N-acetyltransferase [bacterium]|nr:GNAT family N-acetyltransferase [bacterium]MCM1423614.1 GNAT family N-acetyltransferase [bacterium]
MDKKIKEEFGDILVYLSKNADWESKGYSGSIDLTRDVAQILSDFHKNRKYEVKRAKERDGISVAIDMSPDGKKLEEVRAFYDRFAASKNLPPFDLERYEAATQDNIFLLASAYSDAGDLLVVNGYLLDHEDRRSTFSFGASHFREQKETAAQVGRANSYLHYAAMCFLKDQGYREYDLGGIYIGEDRALTNISYFKKSLGGELREYAPKISFQKKAYATVDQNLGKLRDIVCEKGIIIWGAATWGRYTIKRLKELYDAVPICVIDTALSAACSEISHPDELSRYDSSEHYLIVTTDRGPYKAICENESVKPFLEKHSILCIKEDNL